MRERSNRIYTNIDTNERFRMYVDNHLDQMILVNEQTGKEIKNFCAAAFNGVYYRLKNLSEIYLCSGQFFEIDPDNQPTHNKYFSDQRYRKIKD